MTPWTLGEGTYPGLPAGFLSRTNHHAYLGSKIRSFSL